MSDNPFAEPDDPDRTIIRPVPGGRRPATPPPQQPAQPSAFESAPPPVPPRAAAQIPADGAEHITFGLNPLVMAAAPLLQLLGRLRNTYSQPDPGELRERAIQQVRAFEQATRDSGVPMDQLRPAHYALCASLDDVVLNTPWGSSGGWAARSLVSTFHQEVRSGERFFVLLDQLKPNPGNFLPVLELMYLCLSLGFQGQYRLSPRGPGELDRIREDLYTIIMRQRQAADPALSPHWPGVQAPYKPARVVVPTWVMGAGALAIIGILFVWFSTGLNAASDDVFAGLLSAPQAHMPAITRAAPVKPPPPPPQAPAPDPLYVFLKPEIDQGLVTVLGDHAMPIVRIRNSGMFASGSATVAPSYYHLLQRIGEALKAEKGPVTVDGYTDNQPIKTVQFPSNFQLSQARADAAKAIIAKALGDPGRITAQGHADADPIASNATPEGRDQNRRIEVVLRRQG
jgi:type VI secretion system protein ImpK